MKKILALAMALAIVATLVGCGGTVTFNTEDWADMNIRVAGYRNFNDDPLNYEFAEGAKKFAEEYGTTVEFLVGGKDGMGDDLVAGIVAGDPWEIQYCFGISVFPTTFAEELYTPITDYIDYENNDMIDKIMVEGSAWRGEYYGVSSLPMQEIWYIAYNETWMKELGIKTPHEYLAEDNWTMDAYKEINEKAFALGAKSASATTRPHVSGKYLASWDEETGTVTSTYDSPENVAWLSFWEDLLADGRYCVTGSGLASARSVIMRDEVMPNLIKGELAQETTDTIRYIHFPNEDGGYGSYLTDSYFLFPMGVSEEKLPCAFMLACYMTDMKSKIVTEEVYKANMTEEDFAIWEKNLENVYYLPRYFFPESDMGAIRSQFRKDISGGKSVATHIAENAEMLRTKAEDFNAKYSE